MRKTVHTGGRRETTYFLYDGHRLSAEIDAAGTLTRQYLYLGTLPLALLEGGRLHWLHPDALGTPQAVTGERTCGVRSCLLPFPRRLLFGSRANNAAKNDRLSLGRPVAYTLPGGQQVTYHYNDTGRLAALHLDGKPVLNDIRYDSLGRMTHATWGNGLARRADYDRHGRLHKHQRGPDTITYAYDPAGNLTAQNDERYHYDALDRLTGAEHTVAGTLAYAYDANGNRTAQTVNGQTMPYHIQPGSNRLIQAGDEVLHYDAAGSLVEDGRFAYHYNARGRLERVVDKSRDREIARYRYNALGLRTAKTVAGKTTYYTYAPNGMLTAESDANGKLLKQYLWLGITPMAVLDHTSGAPVLHYLHTDHLGTPRSATNAAGNITWRWRSTPFGEGAPEENRLALNLRFPGQYFDQETGWHYNQFRYYWPNTGRYLSPDRLGIADALNPYAYANNSPLLFFDISGLAVIFIDPGHGDHNADNGQVDPGAVATIGGATYFEKDLALEFSLHLGRLLEQLGHEVHYSRTGDIEVVDKKRLEWRTEMSNAIEPDLFLSLHFDSSPSAATSGASIFYQGVGGTTYTAQTQEESLRIANTLGEGLTSQHVRTVSERNLAVLRRSISPALLIEIGFLTNKEDILRAKTDCYAIEMAHLIDLSLF